MQRTLDELQTQVSDLLAIVNDDRDRRGRFQMMLGMSLAVIVVIFLLFNVLKLLRPPTAPEHVQWITAPVIVDGKTVELGIELKKWTVPPEMNAYITELARQELSRQKAEKTNPNRKTELPTKEELKQQNSWFSRVTIFLFGLLVAATLFAVTRMVLQGVRQGKRQRK
jgi:hypothetical protein